MALTRITKGVIKPNENYDTHNINSTGIVTAIGLDINGNGDVSGNLSVGGVLTYEDVTSIDSVGIITARDGIHVGAGVSAVGVGTFGKVNAGAWFANSGYSGIWHTGMSSQEYIIINGDGVGNKGDTFITAKSGGGVRIRPSGNSSFGELLVTNHVITANTDFVPASSNSYDLGRTVNKWLQIHANGLNLHNTGIATMVGADISGDLDVDGISELDITNISETLNVVGVSTFQNNVHLLDNDYLYIGGSAGTTDGIRIYHNGNNSFIRSTNKSFYIGQEPSSSGFPLYVHAGNEFYLKHYHSNGGQNSVIKSIRGGAFTLYHGAGNIPAADTIRLETTSTGINFPRDIDVDGHTNLDNVSISGVTTTSNSIHINQVTPEIQLNAINHENDFRIINYQGAFVVQDVDALANRFVIQSDGTTTIQRNLNCTGDLTLTSTDSGAAAAPTLKLQRDSSSPANGDILGQIMFGGKDSTPNDEQYAMVAGKIIQAGAGGEHGAIQITTRKQSAHVITANLTSTDYQLLNGTNLSVDGDITGNGNFQLTSTDTGSAAAPELTLHRNSASPADADYLGQIKFSGKHDAGSTVNYAKITGKILDASNGTEDGILEFAHIRNGSQTITGRWRSDSLQLLNDTNLSVAGDTTLTGDLDVDGHTNLDNVSITGVTTSTQLVNITRDASQSTSTPLLLQNSAAAGNGSNPDVVKLAFGSQGAVKASIRADVYGNGNLTFHTNNDTEKLRITASGNLGVKVSNPTESLHVAGSIINSTSVNSTGDKGIALGSGHRLGFDQSGTRSWTMKANAGNLTLNSGDGNGAFDFNTTAHLKLPTGTTAQRVNSTGALRYNSDIGNLEFYTGSTWKRVRLLEDPPSNGLLAYWPFSSASRSGTTYYDQSGNNLHLTVNGTITDDTTESKFNGCIDFGTADGNHYLKSTLNSFPDIDSTSGYSGVSISVWVKTTVTNNYQQWIISEGTVNTRWNYFVENATGPKWRSVNTSDIIMSGSMMTGNWHHLVVTYNSSNNLVQHYRDGSFTNQGTTGAPSFQGNYLLVGQHSSLTGNSASYRWRGKMAHMRIYNRVLTESEVTVLSQQW